MTNDPTRLIHVPVPPMLTRSLGYPGQQRVVGFWHPEDEPETVCYYDGTDWCYEVDVQAWYTFVTHWKITPHLTGFCFGDTCSAEHMLIVDSNKRILYVSELQTGRRFIDAKASNTPYHRPYTNTNIGTLRDRSEPDELNNMDDLLIQHLNNRMDSLTHMATWLGQNGDN